MRQDRRAVWGLAWPMIVSNVSVPLLGLVDTAILGHLPHPTYLAAVAVGTTLLSFAYWGFGFLRMGTTGLASQADGWSDAEAGGGRLRLLLAQGLVLGATIAGLILLLREPIMTLGLTLMAPAADVAAEARIYLEIRLWSAPAVLATYAVTGWLVGVSDTRSVLLVTVTTNLVNIALDLLLVLGLGLRTEGVALATLVAEYTGLVLALVLVSRRLARRPGRLDRGALLRPAAYRELLAVNGHLFIRTLVLIGTLSFFTAQGARQGEVVLAANALLMNLLMLVSYGLDGFAHAAEALTGRAIGARDASLLRRRIGAAAEFSLATATGFALLFALAGWHAVTLLTDLPAVVASARDHLPWLVALPLIAVWCFLFDGVFIGATRTRAMRDTMLLSALGVFLPLWWSTRGLGNHGLWLALDTFFAARGLTLGWALWRVERAGGWFAADATAGDQPPFGRRG